MRNDSRIRSGSRATLLVAAKVALVVLGLGVLVIWLLQSGWGSGRNVRIDFLLLAIALNQAALMLAGLRLWQTLRPFGSSFGRRPAVALHLKSLFYFFFVPFNVGLEVSRFVKIRQLDPHIASSRVVIALLLDRIWGVLAAALVVLPTLFLVGPKVLGDRFAGLLAAGFLLTSSVGLGVWLVARRRGYAKAREALRAIQELRSGLHGILTTSLFAHLSVCAAVSFFALALGIDIGVAEVLFAVSVALLTMVVPASLLGVSAAEFTGAGILIALGLSSGDALVLALAPYLGRLLGAFQGGVIEFLHDGRALLVRRSS